MDQVGSRRPSLTEHVYRRRSFPDRRSLRFGFVEAVCLYSALGFSWIIYTAQQF